jgi:hypothetical protein
MTNALPEPEGRVAVVDLDGRPLSPCSPAKAAENITLGLADWRADGVLHLRYRPLAYRAVYRRVLKRDRFRCAWCGAVGSTLDHVVPVSWGGQARLDNCVVACRACNHARHELWPSEFAARMGFKPTHPVITAVLADEAARFAASEQAVRRRRIEECRSKDEAQVWAAVRRDGHLPRQPMAIAMASRVGVLAPHPLLYLP